MSFIIFTFKARKTDNKITEVYHQGWPDIPNLSKTWDMNKGTLQFQALSIHSISIFTIFPHTLIFTITKALLFIYSSSFFLCFFFLHQILYFTNKSHLFHLPIPLFHIFTSNLLIIAILPSNSCIFTFLNSFISNFQSTFSISFTHL